MTILHAGYSRLKNKTAWITGGKRVGQVVAQALAEQGVNIIASYKSSQEEAEAIVSKARSLGVKAIAVKADVAARESVVRAVKEVTKIFPQIDMLINMASVFKPVRFDEITQQDWDVNINVHMVGAFWVAQLIAPLMPPGSHIVNIVDRTSIGRKYKGYLPYVVTKGAAAVLTETLAVELAPKGIFVDAIAPGPILRPPDISELEWKKIREDSPLKYPIDDEEAERQFALEVLHLCIKTMTSGEIAPLDQGQNL